MNPIVYITSKKNRVFYEGNSFFTRIKDIFSTNFEKNIYIEELNLNIFNINIPPNINKKSYFRNIDRAKKFVKNKNIILAPKVYRKYDYELFNDYQKKFFAFSIVKSIQLVLRLKNKSIKNSYITIYDANDSINTYIIYELCKYCKSIILLSNKIHLMIKLRESIVKNYGISPIITSSIEYAIKNCDFIISSKEINFLDYDIPVWYIYNLHNSIGNNKIYINDITYSCSINEYRYSIELLGAILSQFNNNSNIENLLKLNKISLSEIKFNDKVLSL